MVQCILVGDSVEEIETGAAMIQCKLETEDFDRFSLASDQQRGVCLRAPAQVCTSHVRWETEQCVEIKAVMGSNTCVCE